MFISHDEILILLLPALLITEKPDFDFSWFFPYLVCHVLLFGFQWASKPSNFRLSGFTVPWTSSRSCKDRQPFGCLVMGSSGLEPPTSRLSGARSNLLSYEPVRGTALRQTFCEKFFSVSFQKLLKRSSWFFIKAAPLAIRFLYRRALFIRLRYLYTLWLVGATDWRWWDSNPWPPACRAGALPTELHPHWCVCSLLLQWTLKNDNPSKLNNKQNLYFESRRPWL